MKKSHLFRNLALLCLLIAGGVGGVFAWFRVDEMVQPVLQPTNASYRGYSLLPKKAAGLKLEPFTFKGWDDGEVQAVLATREGEESSRQLSILGNLAATPAERLGAIDYVLVCVDWDHGIRSALPLAESLTAAGLTCVLWEPRGANNRRDYCTHGLKENKDVPLLIDALAARSGKKEPVIAAVGQGYGAGLLLQAAAHEPRIRGLVSIDAYASLRRSVQRTMADSLLAPLTVMLMDLRINHTVGMECFDVAPVESAAEIDRHVPVLVLNLAQDSPVSDLSDAVIIYSQLRSSDRDIRTLRNETDPADAEYRRETYRKGSDAKAKTVAVDVRLCRDEDAALADVVHWLNQAVVDAVMAPRVNDPARPILSSKSRL